MIHDTHESYEKLAVAGETYVSADGIEYIIFSNKTQQIKYRFATNLISSVGKVVKAYTTDLSVDMPNGNLNGVRVHWVTMKNDDFAYKFSLKCAV